MGILKKAREKQQGQAQKKVLNLEEYVQVAEKKRVTKSTVEVVKPSVPVIPEGYTAIGCNEKEKLLYLRDKIINEYKIFSYDYEGSNRFIPKGKRNKEREDDPQDVHVVGVSFAFKIGQAFYLPIDHVGYEYNWDKEWLNENFLKPVLLHPDVTVIAHNFQAEHKYNKLDFGINLYPKARKRKVVDTMYLLQAVAPNECMTIYTDNGRELAVGLKDAARQLLADKKTGLIHGILKADDIKEFEDMVTVQEVIGYYKSGNNKGLPKYRKKYITFGERPVDQETIDYAASDSDWALGLYHLLMPVAEREGLLDVLFELDFPYSLVLANYELTGWHASKERLERLREIAEEELYKEGGVEERLHRELLKAVDGYAKIDSQGRVWIPAGAYPMGVHRGEQVFLRLKEDIEFTWTPRCLQWLFFHVLQIPFKGMKRSTTTGLPATDKDNLEKILLWYADHAPLIKVFKEKKKYDKILSTYVEGMGKYIREDSSRIHTNLRRVKTWRLASSKPNLQNIPRADNDPLGIRGVFVAPKYDLSKDYSHLHPEARPNPVIFKEGLSGETVLIGCDYSQIELKVLAWYAMEQRMIETLASGGDLHSVAAIDVFKLDCTPKEVKSKYKMYRYRAKKVNFGIVYGMTEYGLSDDPGMGMDVQGAKKFIQDYYRTYPGIRRYADEQIAFAQQNGYVQTMFGHRRNIPEINSANKWERQKAENKAMNTPIQGSAADIIAFAMVNFENEIPEVAPYLKPVMQIHDELIFECPVEYAVAGAKFIKSVMERTIPGFSEIMPIVAEPAIGKIWKDSLDVSWDDKGNAWVTVKKFEDIRDKEALDLTKADIEYALYLYDMAGIEVREKWVPSKRKEMLKELLNKGMQDQNAMYQEMRKKFKDMDVEEFKQLLQSVAKSA